MRLRYLIIGLITSFVILFDPGFVWTQSLTRDPVDYVNPYMGNISHLLVPTYPTIHLPNSMLRVYPEREDFTSDVLRGLPLMVTSHRGRSAFSLSPFQGSYNELTPVVTYSYDNEKIKPYRYSTYLDEQEITVDFAPSHQAAIYELGFTGDDTVYLSINTRRGELQWDGQAVYGYQELENHTKVFLFLETKEQPVETHSLNSGGQGRGRSNRKTGNVVLQFKKGTEKVHLRYGVSFIDEEQARRNLRRELKDYNVEELAGKGREIWNETLGKLEVESDHWNDKAVFYTSLYRTYERPVKISEDGRYFSAFDGKIHEDGGVPFYTDDWIWDSYRAAHPLRTIVNPQLEHNIIRSFLRMSGQMPNFWWPTFPEVTGDSRRMNSNHGIATVIDAYRKGIINREELAEIYPATRNAILEKTLAPWSGKPAGALNEFYQERGYIPALREGEKEIYPDVNSFEKRQPVAVTLGTSYDEWCLAQIAKELGNEEDYRYFLSQSLNYRHLFNPQTQFFHPKDAEGQFIEPFDYRFSGGLGARNYYGENNGWVYRWDVQHNIPDLIQLMGGDQHFVDNLDQTFREPLGKGKSDFYAQLPDHTGNVGQFSMANEPSLHIPYLYNYAGAPWKTQKRIHTLIGEWFRNDLMGVPGDEDGGGLSSFVVFSMMGIYPVTPGNPVYNIGSPFFEQAVIHLPNGKKFVIEAKHFSKDNKYIQSAQLNGRPWNRVWISHDELMKGGKLVLEMGEKANKNWAASKESRPPLTN